MSGKINLILSVGNYIHCDLKDFFKEIITVNEKYTDLLNNLLLSNVNNFTQELKNIKKPKQLLKSRTLEYIASINNVLEYLNIIEQNKISIDSIESGYVIAKSLKHDVYFPPKSEILFFEFYEELKKQSQFNRYAIIGRINMLYNKGRDIISTLGGYNKIKHFKEKVKIYSTEKSADDFIKISRDIIDANIAKKGTRLYSVFDELLMSTRGEINGYVKIQAKKDPAKIADKMNALVKSSVEKIGEKMKNINLTKEDIRELSQKINDGRNSSDVSMKIACKILDSIKQKNGFKL